MTALHEEIERVLLTSEQIQARVVELAADVCGDYRRNWGMPGEQTAPLCVVAVLTGAAVFASDLIRNMDVPLTLDFVGVSSYGKSATSSGTVRITKDLETDIGERAVLLVEDIIDTGLTVRFLADALRERAPSKVAVCALLDKPSRRKVEIKPDYCGFEIPDEFVVGYGLDYAGRHRNLPFVAALRPEVYESRPAGSAQP